MLVLRDKQLITFKKSLANKRFLDRSHAGVGKTAPACCLTGFIIGAKPQELSLAQATLGIPLELTTSPFSATIVTKGKYNARAVWIQPVSLMKKNRKEVLMWNPHFSESDVKMVVGTAAKKKSICLDPNTLVWLMTPQAFVSYYKEMRVKFPDIFQIVCDEPHMYYRGFKSARTNFFVTNVPKHVRIHFLTATPTPRGKLTSAYVYCHMIQQDYYGCYEWFINTHADIDDYGNPQNWKQHDRLWRFLDHYSICWTGKDMYGDVDEIILREVLPIHPDVLTTYRTFEAAGVAELQGLVLEAKGGGVESLRCRQMLNHPHHINIPIRWNADGTPAEYSKGCVFSGVTPKMERILELAEAGEPLVVFCSFIAEIQMIADTLKKHKHRVGVINSHVSLLERYRVDEKFQNGELDIVVCSAATAGVGFNWGHVDTVIFHSLNYGDDEFLQAIARAKRGVRTNTLNIILLEYENSIDQPVMWAVHHNSRNSHLSNKDNPIIFFPKVVEDQTNTTISPTMLLTMDYHDIGQKVLGNGV